MVKSNLNLRQGIKFDGKNHNWTLFKNYLSLPFSFITMVMRKDLEEGTQDSEMFDAEAYNYLNNRVSGIMEGSIITDNSARLQYVL